jgi:hypothetical protein
MAGDWLREFVPVFMKVCEPLFIVDKMSLFSF